MPTYRARMSATHHKIETTEYDVLVVARDEQEARDLLENDWNEDKSDDDRFTTKDRGTWEEEDSLMDDTTIERLQWHSDYPKIDGSDASYPVKGRPEDHGLQQVSLL